LSAILRLTKTWTTDYGRSAAGTWHRRGIPIAASASPASMRVAGLAGVSRRKFRTTVRHETARPARALVDRQFTTAGPDRLWVADITYVPT
jgi:putative transposase